MKKIKLNDTEFNLLQSSSSNQKETEELINLLRNDINPYTLEIELTDIEESKLQEMISSDEFSNKNNVTKVFHRHFKKGA